MASFCQYQVDAARILDPGAGSGILSIAIIESLIQRGLCKSISLVCYENDKRIVKLLRKNLNDAKKFCEKNQVLLTYEIRILNFITSNAEGNRRHGNEGIFDIVICNRRYKIIWRISEEAMAMEEIIHGQRNLYFLFMAMALNLLRLGGEYIFIVPRSWTSGLYFVAFRKRFFANIDINSIHLFLSRDKVFKKQNVLQETMILYGIRENSFQREVIHISTSDGSADFDQTEHLYAKKDACFQPCNGRYLFLPSNDAELKTLKYINLFQASVEERGYKFRTGRVVDFRNKEYLHDTNIPHTCPLIWPVNFLNGEIKHPIENAEKQYISIDCKSVLMVDQNYLLVKRFTSKEEKRRLQPAIYKTNRKKAGRFISTENHLNYLTKKQGEITDCELYGFFVLLSSTLWDQYYRILNGSTQVNAAELNSMPIPPIKDICELGQMAIKRRALTTSECDSILEDFYESR
jgi:adenine-specific DNA-methyltransferase